MNGILLLLKAALLAARRVLIHFLIAFVFPISNEILGKRYKFVSINSLSGAQKNTIYSQTINKFPMPDFITNISIDVRHLVKGQLHEPEVAVFCINNAAALSRTDFILLGNEIAIPDVMKPEKDILTIEFEGRGKYLAKSNRLQLLTRPREVKIESGLSLFGQANGNYAHWLTESLPKLVLADDGYVPIDVPILVENNLHPKIYDSLDLLNVNNREIIKVSPYSRVIAERLYYISPTAYVPAGQRSKREAQNGEYDEANFAFSGDAIRSFSNKARVLSEKYRGLGPDLLTSSKYVDKSESYPKAIFVERPAISVGNGRLILNEADTKRSLNKIGVKSFNPANMPFMGQVNLFSDLEIAIGAIGASLVNLIFTKSGCEVIVISPTYTNANFAYFPTLLGIFGHHVTFVIGHQDGSGRGKLENKNFWSPTKTVVEVSRSKMIKK